MCSRSHPARAISRLTLPSSARYHIVGLDISETFVKIATENAKTGRCRRRVSPRQCVVDAV